MSKKMSIGLDIGSSAVRAAEVMIDGDRKVLRRFAQVGLPAGAVIEGEVRDREAVANAIKRLWQHGRFSSKKVVVGLGSQRAMVRQVEMPPLPDSELRSALRLKIGEFLPIPVEQAVVDFAPLPSAGGGASERRLLLVAAQRDVIADELGAVDAAGLSVVAVDSSSLALLRAVAGPKSPAGGPSSGLEAVVGIGAELITVAVRDGGTPRFMRTVALTSPGGPSANDPLSPAVSPGDRSRPTARSVTAPVVGAAQRLESIVAEVRSSLEYLLSQSGTGHFEQVLLTGGGAMLPGVTEALSSSLGLPVKLAELPFEVDHKELGLDKDALDEASYRWLSAVGLALWGTDTYGKPSLLPPEVAAKRQQVKVMQAAAVGVVVIAAALGVTSIGKVDSAHSISNQIKSDQTSSAAFQVKINGLGYVLKIPAEVQSRRALAVDALSGDIDWIGLVNRLDAAMPPGVKAESITLTKTEANATGGPLVVTPGSIVGTLIMTAETTAGAPAVAQFIDRESQVKGLFALWVSSTTKTNGQTQIEATAELTTGALSARAAALPGGVK
ncbi:MAG: type IV pilus assembly protein PilM [Acidimicrobiales bacterium]